MQTSFCHSFFLVPHKEIWNNPPLTAFNPRQFRAFLGDPDVLLHNISSPSFCLFCMTYLLFKI